MDLQRALRSVSNVTVLDGDTTYRQGLLIYGLGHPVHSTRAEPLDDQAFADQTREVDARVLADVERLPSIPDIVAVHDDRMAESLAGVVPLVISGHFHETGARVVNGTLYLRIGSTAGVGPVTLSPEGNVPLSAEILYFQPGSPPTLTAFDEIEQFPAGTLTVTRHLVSSGHGNLVLTPPPSPAPSATAQTSSGA
jgi:hypothetical protein